MSILLLEGIDGSGKSTVAEKLHWLAQNDCKSVLMLRDPGSTTFGERIRETVADPDIPLSPMAQTLAFMAARAQLTATLAAEVHNYDLIILDRYWPSTIAYQCFAGGIDRNLVLNVVDETDKKHPEAHIDVHRRFCLMVDPVVAHERRMAETERASERFKAAGMAFKQRVAEGYQWMVHQDMLTPIEVGKFTPEEVAKMIYKRWVSNR